MSSGVPASSFSLWPYSGSAGLLPPQQLPPAAAQSGGSGGTASSGIKTGYNKKKLSHSKSKFMELEAKMHITK
jgi:hypothetical protein